MAGTSVEDLQKLNSAAVLKFHVGGMLFADEDATAPDPGTLVGTDGTLTVPAGYVSAGRITTDGITKSRDVSTEDVKSWQDLAIVRSDVSGDDLSFKVKFQEYNLVNFALREGLTLDEAGKVFKSSGISSKRDAGGRQPRRRCLMVARDSKYNITLVHILPNLSLSDAGDETYGRSDELQLDATFKVLADDVYGTDMATAVGGPGLKGLFAGAGTTAPAGGQGG